MTSSAKSSIPACDEPARQDFTPSPTQPTTTDALHAFTGHWRVTGSPLQLFAHRDGIALIFTVEANTVSYRKGEVRFELEMSLNGTGFSVRERERPDPGGKTFSDEGLSACLRTMTVTSDDVYYSYLQAWVIDADTLRVQRLVWDARFEVDGEGRIARCPKLEICNDAWDELRHVK